jgi:hypothetical protein
MIRHTLIIAALALAPLAGFAAEPTPQPVRKIPNRFISFAAFKQASQEVEALRAQRRISEEQFIEMAQDPDTVVLDARSRARYQMLHVAGARHLNFSDFTAAALAKVIGDTDTRVLIYCNNNFEKQPAAFPTKDRAVPLNIPTFINLHAYGYHNVYELGPVINPKTARLTFAGTLAAEARR